jgi:long-chain fatty acid transport protein
MKKLLLIGIIFSIAANAWAGGLLTNTNQSVHFLRNPARGASIEIDAVYTNPAGLAKLPSEGFHFSLNNQSAFQTRTITSTFAPFAMNGGNSTKEYEGKANAPFVPSLQAAYKTGDWVFSGSFAVVGGGGKLVFDNGLPSFESQVAMLPVTANGMLAQMGMPESFNISKYSLEQSLEGSSMIFGLQLGATYAINEMFSGFAGARLNMVNNGYNGYLRNIQINPNIPPLGLSGDNMIPAANFINSLVVSGMLPQAQADALLAQVADKEIDSNQSGTGIAPILGFNFNYEKLNVGVKYEFKTTLEVKNETKVDDTGMFPDGATTPHDIPALLTIGAQYDIIPCVTISAGYHHFFDSDAKMVGNKQQYIDGGINEYLFGAEYRINPMFLISAGGQITRTGVNDAYQSDLSYSLNSYSVGFGGAVNVTESIRINAAYFFTNYADWTKTTASMTDVFARTNKAFGIGVDFRF